MTRRLLSFATTLVLLGNPLGGAMRADRHERLAVVIACGELCGVDAVSAYCRLEAAAASGRYTAEQAAFLLHDHAGRLRAQRWPGGGDEVAAVYRGRIPAGCIAIVHTHPVAAPQPSRQDMAEARRFGFPVVVITPGAVTAAEPDGSRWQLLSEGWQRHSH